MVDPNTIHFRSTFEHNPDPYTRTHNRILGPSFKTSPVEDLPTRRASLSLLSTPARGRLRTTSPGTNPNKRRRSPRRHRRNGKS
ncbi:hypothetical protein NPIL_561111 [Nephila pilipes]|uniref:Uncharacterized protein n=1 Tax=Nephila pilipes TaxID=299642 RepID=A0A8X6USF4_NEPPI|nr:hypothetical protein NPIL_561111 [Nephila pilipes]